MIYAVYNVAYIVHVSRDFRKLAGALFIAEFGQYHECGSRGALNVRVGMLSVTYCAERRVRIIDVGLYILVAADILVGNVAQLSFLSFPAFFLKTSSLLRT